MKKVVLGKTGIEVSYLGLGTSAAYDGAVCAAKLKAQDYHDLLLFAYERGVNFWDTSLVYGTHGVIREALKSVPRKNVVICSKTTEIQAEKVKKSVEQTLKEIGSDYIDIFMLQAIRNKFDFQCRLKALDILNMMKKKGYIRAMGIASHGLGALEASRDSDRIDLVMGRINYSGHLMDSRQDDLKSILAGIPSIKKLSQKLLPAGVFKKMAASVQRPRASENDRRTANKIFQELHAMGKNVIGMKILGEGHLAHDIAGAIKYATSLDYITSIVLGCCSKMELTEALKYVD